MTAEYQTIPCLFAEELQQYIESGRRPSPLLQAVLDGDMWAAYNLSGNVPGLGFADLAPLLGWIYGQAPVKSWGTINAVEHWIRAGGLLGLERTRQQQERAALAERDSLRKIRDYVRTVGAFLGER